MYAQFALDKDENFWGLKWVNKSYKLKRAIQCLLPEHDKDFQLVTVFINNWNNNNDNNRIKDSFDDVKGLIIGYYLSVGYR